MLGFVFFEFGFGINELWWVDVGIGYSFLCIVGNFFFLILFDEWFWELNVVCFDICEGKVCWNYVIVVDEIEMGYFLFNFVSSILMFDGEWVICYFGFYGFLCFDMEGIKFWEL